MATDLAALRGTRAPTAREIPVLVTGRSGQTLQWIAANAHGWRTTFGVASPNVINRTLPGFDVLEAGPCDS